MDSEIDSWETAATNADGFACLELLLLSSLRQI